MHGTNKVRKAETRTDGKLQVTEMFYTIQGEGPFAGQPAVFMRLTGCNLRCWFCDTQWNDETDQYYDPMELVAQVDMLAPPHCRLLVITGGEPLRQDCGEFLRLLTKPDLQRWTIQVETAGTLWQHWVAQYNARLVVSPKTPKVDDRVHAYASAFKYVIRTGAQDQDDGLPNMSTQLKDRIANIARPRRGAEVFLSPCDEGDAYSRARNGKEVARLAMKHGHRAGIQLHKYIGVP